MLLDISCCQVTGYPGVHGHPRTDPLTLEVVELIGTVVARYYEEYEQAAAEHSLTGAQARVLGPALAGAACRCARSPRS